MLEFQVEDIVDWLWEEMKLPNLTNRSGGARDDDWTREGWDRRGPRSRLDRRRSLRESVKRQTVQPGSPGFTNDDLRFRQLSRREQPATQAVVFLVLDVSASMGETSRKLAKTFFFWAVQGLRRQYRHLEIVFVAHTTQAWEFAEEEFFQVTGSGGTFMSTALDKVREIVDARYSPAQHNLYLFYASDGENSPSDNGADAGGPRRAARRPAVRRLPRGGFDRRVLGACQRHRPAVPRLAAHGRAVGAFRADRPRTSGRPCGTSSAANRPRAETRHAWTTAGARISTNSRRWHAAQGLDYLPVDFEAVPDSLMMEIAIYGLPVRMPHWSFGVRYIYRLVQHRLGLSRLFEVVFPGNPGHAYLARNNSDAENLLVAAHVLGHADFSANNLLFRRSAAQVGEHIVEQAATHARQIAAAIEAARRGARRSGARCRARARAARGRRRAAAPRAAIRRRSASAPADGRRIRSCSASARWARTSPRPARDAARSTGRPCRRIRSGTCSGSSRTTRPELEPWERDIFLAVREESFYFYPVFACQIMNEGWASYWHARLLREAKFLPQGVYVDAIKCHSDVVRPTASGDRVSLTSTRITSASASGTASSSGTASRRRDASCSRTTISRSSAASSTRSSPPNCSCSTTRARPRGPTRCRSSDLQALHEAMLAPKYAFGAPTVAAQHVRVDGTLELAHDHATDGRGLDIERSRRVLDYLVKVWRRPVKLLTVDADGDAFQISAEPA